MLVLNRGGNLAVHGHERGGGLAMHSMKLIKTYQNNKKKRPIKHKVTKLDWGGSRGSTEALPLLIHCIPIGGIYHASPYYFSCSLTIPAGGRKIFLLPQQQPRQSGTLTAQPMRSCYTFKPQFTAVDFSFVTAFQMSILL